MGASRESESNGLPALSAKVVATWPFAVVLIVALLLFPAIPLGGGVASPFHFALVGPLVVFIVTVVSGLITRVPRDNWIVPAEVVVTTVISLLIFTPRFGGRIFLEYVMIAVIGSIIGAAYRYLSKSAGTPGSRTSNRS